ncbi:MAG TPA: phosphoribosylanthranilate isomerase [Fimbriimonadaceae bacterium]
MVTRVKICGLTRREDVELAIELGASAVGFIFEPTSKRYLKTVPEWLCELPPYVSRVAVYGLVPDFFNETQFESIQASGWMDPLAQDEICRRIEVVRVKPGENPKVIADRAQHAVALFLDTYVEGSYGGTGKAVDWDLAAEVVKISRKPVILAGGLTPDNVAEAIRKVRPYAVDVSSGVESSPGVKDPEKMRAFFKAVSEIS